MCINKKRLKGQKPYKTYDPTCNKWITTTERIVPCGKCVDCLTKRTNEWTFRLMKEAERSRSAYFMTTTYGINRDRDGNALFGELPDLSSDFRETLNPKHHTDFMKRLRKANNKYHDTIPIKYFMCGEYGEKNSRPHYHYIIFNMHHDLASRSLMVGSDIWKKGSVDIASFSVASAAYVVRYIMQDNKHDNNTDRYPAFQRQSNGLGSNFLTPEMIHYFRRRLETQVWHPGGFRIALPRYYQTFTNSSGRKEELFTPSQKMMIEEAYAESRMYDDILYMLEPQEWEQTLIRNKNKRFKHEQRKKQERVAF